MDTGLTNEQQDIFEERAAICEYHGGVDRETAEQIARDEALRGTQEELGI